MVSTYASSSLSGWVWSAGGGSPSAIVVGVQLARENLTFSYRLGLPLSICLARGSVLG